METLTGCKIETIITDFDIALYNAVKDVFFELMYMDVRLITGK
jgi:hypothetical protein